ncbi:MAG: glycosyltransferase family 8 protein [Lentisphaeria bacterium]
MINIALATDRNYLNYALVTTASILYNTKKDTICLYVLQEGLNEKDLNKFRALSKIRPFELKPLKISTAFFKDWPAMRWSISAYYRLILPDLLPNTKKLIYLDCDLLVLDDISKLWNIDLGNAFCAAAATRVSPQHKIQLGLSEYYHYFNSGVMVYNLRKMAQENHPKRFIELYHQYADKLKYPDQDILNICYQDNYYKLPLRWNLINSVYRNPPTESLYRTPETKEALQHPGIVHFTGTHKPWRLLKTTHHPYAFCFRYFATMCNLPVSLQIKLMIKAMTTGYLKSPKKEVPWDKTIINHAILK